ncbi:MAG: polysaccharide lyase 6 family protein [Pseudomonadota bacterium]
MIQYTPTRLPLACLLGTLLASSTCAAVAAQSTRVTSLAEFQAATASLSPGDTVVLSNGRWRDVELVLKGVGREDAPITLRAETPGEVLITGESNLSLSGEHIVVSGLVFRDGFTPTSEVISYRTAKDQLANHTRVTNVVIDSFSNPERHSADTWVAIYGKHNRFDHNTLLNKGNRGVTLAVRMNTEASRENGHIIERNYFGPRQTLGSNGGETLRIGTSHYSREFANTIVRENYFDRTSGELEIISSKSCGNQIRDNVFFESQGTLTMRHGHYTTVENNYFLGNRKPNTGGIRIINEHQTVRHNYLYGLTGHRFRGALVIMNGVPNGPINRYDPVIDSVLDRNVVIDSDHIQLCAGADEERSAPPTGTTMHDNIILSQTTPAPFTVYDDISGISFDGNILSDGASAPLEQGFEHVPYAVRTTDEGLRVPEDSLLERIGFDDVRLPVTKRDTGAAYYPKQEIAMAFRSGREIPVAPGTNTILEAMRESQPGDVLVLENAGEYLLTKYAPTSHTLTILARAGEKPVIRSEKSSFFIIDNGGSLELDNLSIDGAESPDLAGNNVISTSRYSMNQNYSLVVRNSRVTNLDVNHSYDFLKVYRSTFADRIEILDTAMINITGSILALDKETDDLGIYNVENLRVERSTFEDVQGAVANLYRGGTDESTFGPIVTIADNTLTNVGLGKRNKSGASMLFHGVQKLHISDSNWDGSAPLTLFLTNGEPITQIRDVVMKNTQPIRANHAGYEAENVTYQ